MLLVALGVSVGTLTVLAVALACPLMTIVMMKMMMGDRHGSTTEDECSAEHDQSR